MANPDDISKDTISRLFYEQIRRLSVERQRSFDEQFSGCLAWR